MICAAAHRRRPSAPARLWVLTRYSCRLDGTITIFYAVFCALSAALLPHSAVAVHIALSACRDCFFAHTHTQPTQIILRAHLFFHKRKAAPFFPEESTRVRFDRRSLLHGGGGKPRATAGLARRCSCCCNVCPRMRG
jgi:hypothetical protein